MTNPYVNLEEYQFWKKAVSQIIPGSLDPVTEKKIIKPNEKIVTMGSCFAQHLSNIVKKNNFNYYISEKPPANLSVDEAKKKNYEVFSARYGNIYTVRQALQLFERSFLNFLPERNIWKKKDRYLDAFRPFIEPDGFASEEELLIDRKKHLEFVKNVFIKSNWFIFTLGLTEAWRSKMDGSIYPVAPGVASDSIDEKEYEFINFGIKEVIEDLENFIKKIYSVNPSINIILTVSPVPLAATYENRHVLVSTVYSKSVLRVSIDEVKKKFKNVIYFPSYELITTSLNASQYYEDDHRQVSEKGVDHVMRIFVKNFLEENNKMKTMSNNKIIYENELSKINCDEDEITRIIDKTK